MNDYNACRAYAKEWAKGIDVKYTTQTRKTGTGFVSHIYHGDTYIGKLAFAADGGTTWSEWEIGSGWSYTEDIDRWK